MGTPLDLPADLVREIERRAADQGQNLNELVTELLRKGLQSSKLDTGLPRPAIKTHPRTGLPYIECRHGAEDMTPRRVAEILLEQEAAWHNEAR